MEKAEIQRRYDKARHYASAALAMEDAERFIEMMEIVALWRLARDGNFSFSPDTWGEMLEATNDRREPNPFPHIPEMTTLGVMSVTCISCGFTISKPIGTSRVCPKCGGAV